MAHEILESGIEPPPNVLESRGLGDLQAVFESQEWQALSKMDLERELPFIMHVQVDGRECYVRGRMDAVISGDVPKVIDYKYASWRDNAEADYEIQMSAYGLAVMKGAGTPRVVAELWYLKAPMKIVRLELTRPEAERRIADLLGKYFESLSSGMWPMAQRSYCDSVGCGFREQCWLK
jgi:CRISPR/Cas system-associated exonuclease Cas4 (RecB family)